MFVSKLITFLCATASAGALSHTQMHKLAERAAANGTNGGPVSVTPHAQFSSSIGVLGCKIDVNRVAYWPMFPSCDDICVKVSANGRSVHLLRIDQSGGANDISYDAWNYLSTGKSARVAPIYGGGLAATWEPAPMSACADLLIGTGGKLALSAANSMNFISSCAANATWVGMNYALYNIADPQCRYGFDELCFLPPPSQGNQAKCQGHQLGLNTPLTTAPVFNLDYGTGLQSLAL
ncbi:Uu.00g089300.m01.CDS01 [Anthostomella pinea]|uniref:Uu.00g089300.m01.CDS01 n=1 Tax=Anthostomella pinea TaxID=933095 RepID=A0AAI8VMQ3_9PEZI|nr:Uu.00g089300.m01.CDS01 [Anthostomella pinea]